MAKFKGYDWTELSKKWRIKVEGEDDFDERLLEATQEYIYNHIYHNTKKDKKRSEAIANDIREYLKAISDCNTSYMTEVYGAMSRVKNDEELMKFTAHNLGSLWT